MEDRVSLPLSLSLFPSEPSSSNTRQRQTDSKQASKPALDWTGLDDMSTRHRRSEEGEGTRASARLGKAAAATGTTKATATTRSGRSTGISNGKGKQVAARSSSTSAAGKPNGNRRASGAKSKSKKDEDSEDEESREEADEDEDDDDDDDDNVVVVAPSAVRLSVWLYRRMPIGPPSLPTDSTCYLCPLRGQAKTALHPNQRRRRPILATREPLSRARPPSSLPPNLVPHLHPRASVTVKMCLQTIMKKSMRMMTTRSWWCLVRPNLRLEVRAAIGAVTARIRTR